MTSEPEPDHVRILLVSGSTRVPSYTCTLTTHVERSLQRHGAATTQWNLRECPLTIADPEQHDDPLAHPDMLVRQFAAVAQLSDAVVLASPIYHNSYAGVLKNALDHLTIAQFHYKPVGLLGHGGSRSTQAADHLRIVVRGLLGVAIPTQVCTQRGDYRESTEGTYQLESEDVLHRVERFSNELLLFADQCRAARRHVFARRHPREAALEAQSLHRV
jgi:azobenzene reductase